MILDDAEINSTYNGKNKNKNHLSSGDKTPTKYREARGTRNWLHLLELLAKRALYIPQNTIVYCQGY